MKKRQLYTLLGVIILGFGIVIYQNYRALDYLRVLDLRQASIIKEIYSVEGDLQTIKENAEDLDEVVGKLRASWRVLANNPTLNPENYAE